MKILNYFLLYSYPHDDYSKGEEMLPCTRYYSNLSAILYYMYAIGS